MKRLALILALALLVPISAVVAQKQFLNIATGGTAGTYYPLGGAMAELINKNVPNVNATAVSTGASVANLNMLASGEVQMAMVQNDITFYAFSGAEMFKDKKNANLRGFSTLYYETIQVVTVSSTGIRSLADCKGKRVAVGAAGSGTEANARQILETVGITYGDIRVQYLNFAEASAALRDGNVDVAFLTAGYPTAAVRDLAAQRDVVVVPIPSVTADKIIAKYPFYAKQTIAAGAYAKQAAEVPTIAVKAMLVVAATMPEQLVYDLAKAIYGNLDRLAMAHAVGKVITKENASEGMPIAVHPGALRFFQGK
jgi:TRAP transporter TAXI family solute receptor